MQAKKDSATALSCGEPGAEKDCFSEDIDGTHKRHIVSLDQNEKSNFADALVLEKPV